MYPGYNWTMGYRPKRADTVLINGTTVRELRDRAGLTQDQLAAEVTRLGSHLSQGYLPSLEKKPVARVEKQRAADIATALGIPVNELRTAVQAGREKEQQETEEPIRAGEQPQVTAAEHAALKAEVYALKLEVEELQIKVNAPKDPLHGAIPSPAQQQTTERAEGAPAVDRPVASMQQPQPGNHGMEFEELGNKILPSGRHVTRFSQDSDSELFAILQRTCGNEWWLKGGVPSETLPVNMDWYSNAFLEQFPDPEGALTLQRRRNKFSNTISKILHGASFKHIITRAAIEGYVRDGVPNADEHEALYAPGWRASPEERRARIENFIWFLEKFSNYEVALSEHGFFGTWWGIYDEDCVVIQTIESYFGQPTLMDSFMVKAEDAPQVIKERVALYKRIWEGLPNVAKDRQETIKYLRSLLNEISE
jgi:transcriptional regulator with XRE-family HTH domain